MSSFWRKLLRLDAGAQKLTAAALGPRMVVGRPAQQFSVDVPPELLEAMTGGGLIAPRISRNEALQVPAVLRSRNLIAGTLGSLPHTVIGPDRREVESGTYLLGGNIDPDVANSVVLAQTYEDLLFEGIAWWRVTRRGWHGYPTEARHVPVESVHVAPVGSLMPSQQQISPDQPFPVDGQVFIDGVPVADQDVIRFDSPNPPMLRHAARAIRTCLKLDRAAALYSDDPLPLGYFEPREGADPLNPDEVGELLDEWEKSRQSRAWGYMQGLTAKPLQWNPEQLQLADQRQHAVLEIARSAGIDPEDLGVSTTSRTYANREQRNQHLLDYTLGAYVSAVQDRLSMRDVLPRNYIAKVKFAGFLRTDLPTRMNAYKVGLEVGAYVEEEIRELEDRPPLTSAQRARADQRNAAAAGNNRQEPQMANGSTATFTGEPVRVQFDDDDVAETFQVDAEKRTITGMVVPWGKTARSGFSKWRFTPDSLRWSDVSRVKLNLHHDFSQLVGRATRLQSGSKGLMATYKVARGPEGDRALALAEDKILDGFSIEVDFNDDLGDSWQPDPSDESVRLVRQASLRGTALTGMPAFDDARVTRVAATREGKGAMPENDKASAPVSFDLDAHLTKLSEATAAQHKQLTEQLAGSIGESVSAGVKAALESLPAPQDGPQPVRAARYTVTREAPVYSFNGLGHSLVRDAWYAARERDDDAVERLRKYRKQTEEMAKLAAQYQAGAHFAPQTTGTASEIIPPGYRPDLYVPELMQGRPLVQLCSRGTIANATPFLVPQFGSSTGATADHVEGTNPTDGTLAFNEATVTPGAISGRLTLTREIVDSSNPAIDQIALATMRESYNQQTESKVYAALNGTATTTIEYAAATVITDVRDLLAQYPFIRFAAPTGAAMNQKVTRTFATTNGTDGRPLLPSVGAENTAGLGNAVNQGWFIDGLTFVPAWSITDALSDDVVLIVNRADAWVWESPLLTFRYEEKQGPANIEMNVFGYFATSVLRAAGVFAIRNPAA